MTQEHATIVLFLLSPPENYIYPLDIKVWRLIMKKNEGGKEIEAEIKEGHGH
jgi:hypothetical protein